MINLGYKSWTTANIRSLDNLTKYNEQVDSLKKLSVHFKAQFLGQVTLRIYLESTENLLRIYWESTENLLRIYWEPT